MRVGAGRGRVVLRPPAMDDRVTCPAPCPAYLALDVFFGRGMPTDLLRFPKPCERIQTHLR